MNVFQLLVRNEKHKKEDEAEKRLGQIKKAKVRKEKETFDAETLLIHIEVKERIKPLKRQLKKLSNRCIQKQKIQMP